MTDTIIEVHDNAAMVSPSGGDPFHKRAYFLKPIMPSSIDEPPAEISRCFTIPPSRSAPKKLELEVRGWRLDHSDLKEWAEHLAPTYQGIWKSGGIYDAIFISMCEIRKKSDLLRGLGEKWCCETDTFMFAWGEATITLEDVMILGGFSVLGEAVLSPLESREMREVEERLEVVRKGLRSGRGGKSWTVAYTDLLMKEFMKSGRNLEHEAFLVFWLSRYIFQDARDSVNKAVFPIAVRLARGIRIALAQAVLANIYRDLGLLKRSVVASNELKVVIKSPFHLVQVWAWERFLELRPRPQGIGNAKPRIARWDNVYGLNVAELRRILDSAGEGFLWRPYAMTIDNWNCPKYFLEKEKWVVVSPGMNDDELLSFFICLQANELVGFSSKQQYHPHRVALQFGYDQDIPAFGAPLNHITNEMLYIPSRRSEADVSKRYIKWWKKFIASLKHRSMAPEKKAKEAVDEINDFAIPRIHSPKNAVEFVQVPAGGNVHEGNDSLVPPGFPQKRYRLEVGDPMDDDSLTISEALKIRKKHKTIETSEGSVSQKLSADHDRILASSIADEFSVNTMTSERYEKDIARGKALTWGGKKGKRKLRKVESLYKSGMSKAAAPSDDMVSIFADDGPSRTSLDEEQERASDSSLGEKPEYSSSSCVKKVFELKSRVSRLEMIIEVLKSNCRLR